MESLDIVIPAAGKGTRMKEVTKNKISKLLLPLNNKPILYYSLKEATEANALRIHVIVNPSDTETTTYLKECEFKDRINIIPQLKPSGSGDAIYLTKNHIITSHFGLIYPDLLSFPENKIMKNCVELFTLAKKSIIGVVNLKVENPHIGNIAPIEISSPNPYHKVISLGSKKQFDGKDKNLPIRYILPKTFFEFAEIERKTAKEEISANNIIKKIIDQEQFLASLSEGLYLDTGNSEGYYEAKRLFQQ